MKILVIDPHQPIYFWQPMSAALAKHTGWQVTLMQNVPVDITAFDVVVSVYLSEITRALSQSMTTIPLIGVSMGTDAVTQAGRGINSQGIARIVAFNSNHATLIRDQIPGAVLHTMTWPANDAKLQFKVRPSLPKEGPIRLINIALHHYSKGLDNLIQMLSDVEREKDIELHVIGSVGPYANEHQYLHYFVPFFTKEFAKFKFIYYGDVSPTSIDQLVESIDPHAYITASQGEAGATTVAEGLLKGLPVFVQDHPFRAEVYPDNTPGVVMYHNASSLNKQINAMVEQGTKSEEYRENAQKFNMLNFCEEFSKVIKEVVEGRKK